MMYKVKFGSDDTDAECDKSTLLLWVKEGRLLANHLIWDEVAQSWVMAKDFPLLSNHFSKALWEAWAVEDDWELDPDIETSIRRRLEMNKKEITQEETTPREKKFKTLPLSAISPLESDESSSRIAKEIETSARPKSNLTTSSNRSTYRESNQKTSAEGEHQKEFTSLWQQEVPLKQQSHLWVREERKKTFSVFRIGILVVPFLTIFMGIRWYILSEAAAVFPLETEVNDLSDGRPVDVLLDLEGQIRSTLRNDTQTVSPSSSLSDALRIDLEYAKLEIHTINAKVLSWKGRFLQDPREASIKISIVSAGEPDRELATISMIVAKYTERYLMDMEEFTVVFRTENGDFQKNIAVKDARNLLLYPGSLEHFLTTVME